MIIDEVNTPPQLQDAIGIFTLVNKVETCVGYKIIKDTLPIKITIYKKTSFDSIGYSPKSSFRIRWWKSSQNCETVLQSTDTLTKLDTNQINISQATASLPFVNYSKSTFTKFDKDPSPTISDSISNTIIYSSNGLSIDSTKGTIYIQNTKANTYTINLKSNTCLRSNSIAITIKDSIIIPVTTAPDLSKLTYSTLSPGCKTLGSIYFKESTIIGSRPFDFLLTNTYTGEHIQNKTVQFDDLREGVYQLRVIDSAGVESVFGKNIALLKTEECTSAILAPNAKDGLQAIFIPEVGNAKILDRDGAIIKQLSIPAEWDGKDSKGSNVPMGDYYLFINEEQAKVITVIR